jgi:hypothetical protein
MLLFSGTTRTLAVGPPPEPELLGRILLERAAAIAQAKFAPRLVEDMTSEIVARALPRARRWRAGGTRSLRAYVGGACFQAAYDIIRERQLAIEYHAGRPLTQRQRDHIPAAAKRHYDLLDAPSTVPLDSLVDL